MGNIIKTQQQFTKIKTDIIDDDDIEFSVSHLFKQLPFIEKMSVNIINIILESNQYHRLLAEPNWFSEIYDLRQMNTLITLKYEDASLIEITPKRVLNLCINFAHKNLDKNLKKEYYETMEKEVTEFPNKTADDIIYICTDILSKYFNFDY